MVHSWMILVDTDLTFDETVTVLLVTTSYDHRPRHNDTNTETTSVTQRVPHCVIVPFLRQETNTVGLKKGTKTREIIL